MEMVIFDLGLEIQIKVFQEDKGEGHSLWRKWHGRIEQFGILRT